MKKLVSCILLPAMVISVLAGGATGMSAGSVPQSKAANSSSQTFEQRLAASGKTIRLGTLTFNNLTQEKLSDNLNAYYKKAGKKYNFAYTYFDTLSSALMALKAGHIDRIDMNQSTAQYIAKSNSDISVRKLNWDAFDFQMAALQKNASLLGKINSAIAAMKSDGTLKSLINKQINSVLNGQKPGQIKMPVINGAGTVRVAVTGDLPPMDYITADGKAAGFNVAFLAELSKRIKKNIKLISVDSGARLTALSAGSADALFWARTTGNAKFKADVPAGMKLSRIYFTDPFYGVYLKKNLK